MTNKSASNKLIVPQFCSKPKWTALQAKTEASPTAQAVEIQVFENTTQFPHFLCINNFSCIKKDPTCHWSFPKQKAYCVHLLGESRGILHQGRTQWMAYPSYIPSFNSWLQGS